ncbi:MAG: hypothetical protein JJE22_06790 [Bacteroidia bacterium]|nr:hypothetical protein [Bacteroidia bacterium]
MSNKNRNIRNLDTLEKEIYRLQLEAKQIEERLDSNLDHFQHNYAYMAMNSLFHRSSGKEKVKEKIFSSILENEKISKGIDKIFGYLADKTAEGIENLFDRIFHKKS